MTRQCIVHSIVSCSIVSCGVTPACEHQAALRVFSYVFLGLAYVRLQQLCGRLIVFLIILFGILICSAHDRLQSGREAGEGTGVQPGLQASRQERSFLSASSILRQQSKGAFLHQGHHKGSRVLMERQQF